MRLGKWLQILPLPVILIISLSFISAMGAAQQLVVQENLGGQIGETVPVKIGAASSSALELGGLDFEFWFQSNVDLLRSAIVRIENDSISVLSPGYSPLWTDGSSLPLDDEGKNCRGNVPPPQNQTPHFAGPGIHSVGGEKVLISAYGNSDVIRGAIQLSYTSGGQWQHQNSSGGPAFLLYPICMESHGDTSEWVNPAADPSTYGDITEICKKIGVSFTSSIEIGGYYYIYFSVETKHGSSSVYTLQVMRVEVDSAPPYAKFGPGRAQLFHKGHGQWYDLPYDPEFGYYLNICGQAVCTSTHGGSMQKTIWCQEPITQGSATSWSVTQVNNFGFVGGISRMLDGSFMLTHAQRVGCSGSGIDCKRTRARLAYWRSFDPAFSDSSMQFIDTSRWLEDTGSTSCPVDDTDSAWYVDMGAVNWWVYDLPSASPDMIGFTSYHDARCDPWTRGKVRAFYIGPEGAGGSQPELCVSIDGVQIQEGAEWNFGSTPSGVHVAESAVLTNCGIEPLIVSDATLSGANAPNFNISSNFLNQLPMTLESGQDQHMWVGFLGNAEGPRAANLRIASNDSADPEFDLPLTGYVGTASEPEICVSVDGGPVSDGGVWDFGSTPPGVQVAESALLTNCGTDPLTIDAASLSGTNVANFTISSNFLSQLPITIQPGQQQYLWVALLGNAVGPRTAGLSISSDSSSAPVFDLALTGYIGTSSTPALCVTVDGSSASDGGDWNFGSTAPGVQVAEFALLTNCGTASLTINNATLSGTNALNFTIATSFLNQLPITLTPGSQQYLWVAMLGNAQGPRNANLTISSNNQSNPGFGLALSGVIVSP